MDRRGLAEETPGQASGANLKCFRHTFMRSHSNGSNSDIKVMDHAFYDSTDFEPDSFIGYLVKRIAKLSMSQFEAAFATERFSFSHWLALEAIRHGGIKTGAQLARNIGHDSGATTRLVRSLSTHGLIERTRCVTDKRIIELACTAEGIRRLEELTPVFIQIWNESMSEFDASEIEFLIGMLRRLIGAFEVRG